MLIWEVAIARRPFNFYELENHIASGEGEGFKYGHSGLFTSKNASKGNHLTILSTFVGVFLVEYFGKRNLMCLVPTQYQFSCRTDKKFSFMI